MTDTSSLADIKARHEDGLPDEHDLADAFIRLPNAAWIPDDFRALEVIAERAEALLVALRAADDDYSRPEESQAAAAVSQWNSPYPREVLTTESGLALYDALKSLEQAIGGGVVAAEQVNPVNALVEAAEAVVRLEQGSIGVLRETLEPFR